MVQFIKLSFLSLEHDVRHLPSVFPIIVSFLLGLEDGDAVVFVLCVSSGDLGVVVFDLGQGLGLTLGFSISAKAFLIKRLLGQLELLLPPPIILQIL